MLLSIIESEFIFSKYVSFSSVCNSSASPSPHFSAICIKMHCCYCSVVVAQSCTTLCNSMDACPSQSCKVFPSSCPLHQWCHPAISSSEALFYFCPQSFQHWGFFQWVRDFSNESVALIRWPKYWHSRFSISPCNEYSGLISLKIDWFDDLAVQETLRNVL